MSAQAQMRAMLDQLMGTSRDGDTTRQRIKFSDDRVCKSHLLNCCPHDVLSGTRMDLGECLKVHDLALRADYEIASKEQDFFFELDSTAGASLLANASPLTLMTSPLSVTNQTVTPFGMLGGLVPVTMPFQFPLELLGFGTDTAGVTATSGSTSAALHHSLTQNLLKSLQPGAQHAAALPHSPLPAHLQQAFNDGGQSKGDTKLPRKPQ